jgi:Fe-S cluster assembly iron-binding protein IscA
LALDEPNEGEALTQVNGLDVLVAEEAQPFVDGSQVDFVTTPYGDRFIIRAHSAGC